jgi:IS5 family transposase
MSAVAASVATDFPQILATISDLHLFGTKRAYELDTRFLGLELADPEPDANTIWTFREALPRAAAPSRLEGEHGGSGVWADAAYRSQANERHLASNGLRSQIHRKKPYGKRSCPRVWCRSRLPLRWSSPVFG